MIDNISSASKTARPLATLAVTGLLLGGLIISVGKTQGSLASQRVMVDLIMPVGLIWQTTIFATLAFWFRRERRLWVASFLAFVFVSVLFSPAMSRWMMRQVEATPPAISPLEESSPTFRAVVVLGGGASLGSNGMAQLNQDGHRIAMAAQMWHAGKTEAIICTGEDDFVPNNLVSDDKDVQPDRFNPGSVGVELLESLGVPKERLFRVGGINTTAEMANLSTFFREPPTGFPSDGQIGLITSAFHIPRAMRLAKAKDLKFIPIPVAYRTGPVEPLSIVDFIPNVSSGQQFYMAAKEMLAAVVGR